MIYPILLKILKSFAIGLPIGVTICDCVGYVARVEGNSMQPALNPNAGDIDYVLLNRWAARSYDLTRGEIITLISPKDPDQTIIKRVVGLEDDVISTMGYKTSYVRVPPGHCWIEGDHTGNSLDSNTFGPVAVGLMTAKVTHIIWPPSRWQSLQANSTRRVY